VAKASGFSVKRRIGERVDQVEGVCDIAPQDDNQASDLTGGPLPHRR
jgi:hypothetical protein